MKTVFSYLIIFTTITAIFPTHTMELKRNELRTSDTELTLVPLTKTSINNDTEISLKTNEHKIIYPRSYVIPLPTTHNIPINQSDQQPFNSNRAILIPRKEKKENAYETIPLKDKNTITGDNTKICRERTCRDGKEWGIAGCAVFVMLTIISGGCGLMYWALLDPCITNRTLNCLE